jgi:hypothetical protein
MVGASVVTCQVRRSFYLPEAPTTVDAMKHEDAALTYIASLTEACLSIPGRRLKQVTVKGHSGRKRLHRRNSRRSGALAMAHCLPCYDLHKPT